MKPIAQRKTVKVSVYDELKKAILQGEIGSDEILTETMLADSLEISRTPIREAVADLVNEGLLVQIPRKGFHVPKLTSVEIEQITFLRVSIESEGLRKLAPIITDEKFYKLKDIVDRQRQEMKKGDSINFIELDQLFHRQLLSFSNQNLLEDVLLKVYNLTRLLGHNALMKDGRMGEVLVEHSNIIQALANKNSEEAIDLMKTHLEITTSIVNNANS